MILKKIYSAIFSSLFILFIVQPAFDGQQYDFTHAKKIADRIFSKNPYTFYCGCRYSPKNHKIDKKSCGYKTRKNETRAGRLEWEHVVPAWFIGHQRQCWQNGGRKNCRKKDPIFKLAEGDLHNLVPSIGEINADRSNFRYGMVNSSRKEYGACNFKVDFKQRIAEPRDAVKGDVARITFYIYDKYHLKMSLQQKKLLSAWARMDPVSPFEIARDEIVEKIQGDRNPYIRP